MSSPVSLQRSNTATREELNKKCCLIRMQYHPITRISFEVIWRLMFIMDLFFDIGLCLQYTTRTTIWWLFVSSFCIPYILTAIALFLPFHRRIIDIKKTSAPSQLGVVLLYIIFCLPSIVLLDIYICTRLIITDLSTTRYFLYYWRLKTFVELIFEAIPQTVLLICIGLGFLDAAGHDTSTINVQLLYGSLSMSIMFLIWYCMLIYYGAQSTQLSIYEYVYKYYIMQGMDMIPYQEAITQNLLSDFILTSENLTTREWKQLIANLFCNFSIVKFDISGQQHLNFSLWLQLFECLANNNLNTLKFRDCFIFHPDNLLSVKRRKTVRFSSRFSWTSNKEVAIQANEKKYEDQNTVSVSHLNSLKAGMQALIINIPSLVVVDLSNNCLSQAFRGMIKSISGLKKLEKLYLANNRLSEANLKENEYLMLFRGCVSLKVLDLSDNGLNDADIDTICNAMQTCKEKLKNKKLLDSLTEIKLDENKISIDGANKLLSILAVFRKLSITLQKNEINDASFEDMQSRAAIDLLIADE